MNQKFKKPAKKENDHTLTHTCLQVGGLSGIKNLESNSRLVSIRNHFKGSVGL